MSLRFYGWARGGSGTRVEWALLELGVPYERIVLDRSKGEHRAPDYLALNPNGKVPALVDGDEKYFESLAILLHLGDRYGVAKGLWPKSGPARAEAMSWTTWSVTELLAYGLQHVYHGVDSPVSYKPEDRSAAAAAYCLGQTQRMLDMIEQRLADRDHLLGDFSLVDVPAADVLLFLGRLGLSESRPRVAAWLERCRARPARQRMEGGPR